MMNLAETTRRLLRRPLKPGLIVLQVALTLAIVANALSIVDAQLRLLLSDSGIQEQGLWLLQSRLANGEDIDGQQQQIDLRLLRQMPGVVQAARINALPLADYGWRTGVWPTEAHSSQQDGLHVGIFLTDAAGLAILQPKLVAGRLFSDQSITTIAKLKDMPLQAVISQAMSRRLFAEDAAVGKWLHTKLTQPIQVIGVVEKLQSSWVGWENHEITMLMPARLSRPEANYLLQVSPGTQLPAAEAWASVLPGHVTTALRPFKQVRQQAYREQWRLAIMLSVFTAGLIFLTGTACYALARHWMLQRRHELAIRRSVGANQADIYRLVHGETLLVLLCGLVLGLGVALAAQSVLQQLYASSALQASYVIVAGLMLMLVGHLAVWGIAKRSAMVAPAIASKRI